MTKRIDLVSIITPVYNSKNYLASTMKSVLNQTYKNWEMIVVDDCSKDHSIKIINDFIQKDNRIKLFKHKKNLGVGLARNNAIKQAKGNYIAFLDADDLWKPHKLETQLSFMKENNVAICFSSYEFMDEFEKPINKFVEALPVIDYSKQLKCNYIGNLTGIYNVDVLGKMYMPKIKKRQDWVMWLAMIKKAGHAYGIKEVLATYRLRNDSLSANKIKLLSYNYGVYRKTLNFSRIKSVFYLFKFLYEYFFIKSKQTKTLKLNV